MNRRNKELIKKIISNQTSGGNSVQAHNNNEFEQVPEIEEINYELQKNMYKNLQNNENYSNYENSENINNNIYQHNPRS